MNQDQQIEKTLQNNLFQKIYRVIDKDYFIASTNGKDEIEIGYHNTGITKIKIEFPKRGNKN